MNSDTSRVSIEMMLALTDQLRAVWDARCTLVTEVLRLPRVPVRDGMRDAIVTFDASYDAMLDQLERIVGELGGSADGAE